MVKKTVLVKNNMKLLPQVFEINLMSVFNKDSMKTQIVNALVFVKCLFLSPNGTMYYSTLLFSG